MPGFLEAYAKAFDYDDWKVAEALTYFWSIKEHLFTAGVGNISEIFDGDAPHTPRGCDAQAWGVSEALRVYLKLKSMLDNHHGEERPEPAKSLTFLTNDAYIIIESAA